MEDIEQEEGEKTFIEEQSILDKYKAAGEIADEVIKQVTEKCVVGADIAEICEFGDKAIEEACLKVFNSKKTKKLRRGVAFPTCVSVNHIIGNYSPMPDESTKLEEGDVAKIDLGVHIDGYIAISGHTIFVTANADQKATGKAAAVIKAAHDAKEAALRTLLAGNKNTQVTDVMNNVTKEYGTNMIKGVFSHKLKKHVIDGTDVIASTKGQKHEEYEFHLGDVFGLEIFVSSGSGKAKQSEIRTTVYKRVIENTYLLKSDKARKFIKEVNQKYPTLPFSTRAFEDQTAVRIGVKQAMDHELLEPFQVVEEKKGEVVAHWKASVAVLANGTIFISGNIPFDASKVETDKKIEDKELAQLLEVSMDLKEQKKRKKETEKAPKVEDEKKDN
jgi:curved DNA binding protein